MLEESELKSFMLQSSAYTMVDWSASSISKALFEGYDGRGGVVLVAGPMHSGKTSFLKMMAYYFKSSELCFELEQYDSTVESVVRTTKMAIQSRKLMFVSVSTLRALVTDDGPAILSPRLFHTVHAVIGTRRLGRIGCEYRALITKSKWGKCGLESDFYPWHCRAVYRSVFGTDTVDSLGYTLK